LSGLRAILSLSAAVLFEGALKFKPQERTALWPQLAEIEVRLCLAGSDSVGLATQDASSSFSSQSIQIWEIVDLRRLDAAGRDRTRLVIDTGRNGLLEVRMTIGSRSDDQWQAGASALCGDAT
jgi:hypothetical protein